CTNQRIESSSWPQLQRLRTFFLTLDDYDASTHILQYYLFFSASEINRSKTFCVLLNHRKQPQPTAKPDEKFLDILPY
ncbi:12266_t:CDS:2, partial [Funneliformis geosporum]